MAFTTTCETSTITKGVMFELLIIADLLKRGFEVYRSVSHTSSCDLIAHKNGHLVRMEVKGATKLVKKKRSSTADQTSQFKDCRKFDVIAYIQGGVISYSRSMYYPLNPASEELVLNKINNLRRDSTLIERRA